jgi:threonine dehydratase
LAITSEQVLGARDRLRSVIRMTPVLPSNFGTGLYLKPENLQLTGSFKIRAAYNQVASLTQEEKDRGVVTSSSGNFAQAAAYAASQLGISAKVVMMRSSNPLKVERTRRWGGEVVFCEDRFEAREEKVTEIQASDDRTVIYPYDHEAAVAGNGTIGLELLQQLPEVENVVVPISGGGLISGIALVVKQHKPSVKVWGVQPKGSNATYLSFQAGQPQAIDRARTVADGLTVTRPGRLTFPLIQRYVHSVEAVEEESIMRAVGHFLQEDKLVVEPSGAVPLAAVMEGKVPVSNTLLVLSGGNMTAEVIGLALSGSEQ